MPHTFRTGKSMTLKYDCRCRVKGVFKWRQASVDEARAKKRVRTKIGRLIHIQDDASDRSSFNLPVQATGPDGFKLALVNIVERHVNSPL
jgi:DNA polymerase I-like protein with 3'-5' exonuclease and polymerase domains